MSKRALDVFLATLGLIFASPIMAAVALALKLEGRGPVFHHRSRLIFSTGSGAFRLLDEAKPGRSD